MTTSASRRAQRRTVYRANLRAVLGALGPTVLFDLSPTRVRQLVMSIRLDPPSRRKRS